MKRSGFSWMLFIGFMVLLVFFVILVIVGGKKLIETLFLRGGG